MSFALLAAFTFASFYSDAQSKTNGCGEAQKQTSLYQSFEACEKERASTILNAATSANVPHCQSTIQDSKDPSKLLKQLCSDPNGFSCSRGKAKFFNSKCEISLTDTKDVALTPAFVSDQCKFESKKEEFIEGKRKKICSSELSTEDCTAKVKLAFSDELQKMERDVFYTSARTTRLKSTFERVKSAYLKKIENSNTIPKDIKALILSRMKQVAVNLPPFRGTIPACANTSPTGPDTDVYYRESNEFDHGIVFCVGAMTNLDQMNEFSLIQTFSHELSHSIDPCMLEQTRFLNDLREKAKVVGDPTLGTRAYGDLLSCLRGGTTEVGNTIFILNRNTSLGVSELVEEQLKNKEKENGAPLEESKKRDLKYTYEAFYGTSPDCPHGKTDTNLVGNNASDFRKDSEPVDQVQESFADFMGAEMTGQFLKESIDQGKLTALDQADALASISSEYSQLHGGCEIIGNTHDEHPPGQIRVNRIIMSNETLRKGFSCETAPVTPFANLTCKGI